MVEVTIEPADAARFADAQATLTGGGDGAGCQCQWWTLTGALLDAAIAFASERGARVVEGYAYDTALGGVNVNDLYHGAVSTFEKAGFTRIAPLGTRTVLMERTLDQR